MAGPTWLLITLVCVAPEECQFDARVLESREQCEFYMADSSMWGRYEDSRIKRNICIPVAGDPVLGNRNIRIKRAEPDPWWKFWR